MTQWCITKDQVVHWSICRLAEHGSTHYGTKPKTNEEMLVSLANPDTSNGHSGPSMLSACALCIPEPAESL